MNLIKYLKNIKKYFSKLSKRNNDQIDKLCKAIKTASYEEAIRIINTGLDLNVIGKLERSSPLVIAVRINSIELAKNYNNHFGSNSCFSSISSSSISSVEILPSLNIVELLLAKGADPNFIGQQHPLRAAITTYSLRKVNIENTLNICKLLLQKGAYINTPIPCYGYTDITRSYYTTALHIVAESDLTKHTITILQLFLDYGADPNAVDYKGDTPLHEAIRHGNLIMIRLLLSRCIKIICFNQKSLEKNNILDFAEKNFQNSTSTNLFGSSLCKLSRAKKIYREIHLAKAYKTMLPMMQLASKILTKKKVPQDIIQIVNSFIASKPKPPRLRI